MLDIVVIHFDNLCHFGHNYVLITWFIMKYTCISTVFCTTLGAVCRRSVLFPVFPGLYVQTLGNFVFQPVFLTKEERAAQALKRRQEQVDEQKKKQDEERKKQMEFLSSGRDSMKGWFLTCISLGSHFWDIDTQCRP